MSLRDKAVKGFLWLSSARLVGHAFSWGATIMLARLLTVEDFGLVATAMIFLRFIELINELGIGAAIIQKQELDEDDLNSTFWVSLSFGLLLYGIIFIASPRLSAFFDSAALTSILRVMGLTFVVNAFKTIPYSRLSKELLFKRRSIAEFISIVFGSIGSITLAWHGFGVWSLVFGALIQTSVLTTLVFFFSPWRPRFIVRVGKVHRILAFGIPVVGSRVLWYLYSNADFFIIAKILGAQVLGYYTMAFGLATSPVQRLSGTFNQIGFPLFSKLQSDLVDLRKAFLKMSRFVALIAVPALTGLFLVAEGLIIVFLTEKWLPMLVAFRALCVIGILNALSTSIPWLLMARGQQRVALQFSVRCLVVLPISFLIGVQFGIDGVALAYVLAYPLPLAFLYRKGLGELGLSFSEYLGRIAPALSASAFMAGVVLAFQYVSRTLNVANDFFELFGSCIVGAVAYVGYLYFLRRDVISEVLAVTGTLRKSKTGSEIPAS